MTVIKLSRRQRRAFEAKTKKIRAEMRQLVADAEHWNRMHPNEEPIVVDPDITKDVERRLAELKGRTP